MKIEISNYTRKYRINKKELKQLIEQVSKLTDCREGTISISFVGKKRIRAINRRFRGKDKATNVISFPFMDNLPKEKIIGDIIICPSVASKEARKYGNNFVDYIAFLLIHGFLHLLGYDHIKEKDRLIMERKEEEIFRSISLQNFIKEAKH